MGEDREDRKEERGKSWPGKHHYDTPRYTTGSDLVDLGTGAGWVLGSRDVECIQGRRVWPNRNARRRRG